MASSDLSDLCSHINMKITTVKKFLHLRNLGQEPYFKSMLCKIGHDSCVLHELVDKIETEVQHEEKQKNFIKALRKSAERDQEEAQHLLENIPTHLCKPTQSCIADPTVKREERTKKPAEPKCTKIPPKELRLIKKVPSITAEEFENIPAIANPTVKREEQTKKPAEPKCTKIPPKEPRPIKKVPSITAEEFENIPAYMKGRLKYEQINAVIEDINKAVVGKYRILRQPLKSVSASVRNLYYKFLEEETKDTNGEFFIVENDIREFTQLKVDRRFYNMLAILRHCQRVREVRGAGLVRYVIC